MTNDSERLKIAQWVLERNLGWIAAAEVKVGVIVAIDTAMLGVLAAAFSAVQPSEHTAWACLLAFVAAGALALATFCTAMSVMPRVSGPDSLLFFGRIAQHQSPDYVRRFRSATDGDMLEDCLAQIHRNAEIARDKFKWVRAGMGWSFFAVAPWVGALALLVRV